MSRPGHPDVPPGPRSDEVAAEALRRLASEWREIDPDEAWRRLQRLTEEQRRWVVDQIDAWGPDPDAGGRREGPTT